MSTMASERSWLFDPGLLKLVNQCRRLIQAEFGVKLRLTEDHLEHRLAEYAGKTRSSHLIRTWEALAPQVPNLKMSEAKKTPAKNDVTSAEAQAWQKKIIYRGQEVN